MSRLGEALYLLRLENRLSQKELARRSGVPQPNISNIEKGKDFKVSTLYKLAAALDISPTELVGGVKPVLVDKQKLFRRQTVEKFAKDIFTGGHPLGPYRPLAEVLRTTLDENSGKKDLHLSWMKLRRTLSSEELNSLLSRIHKAKQRTA